MSLSEKSLDPKAIIYLLATSSVPIKMKVLDTLYFTTQPKFLVKGWIHTTQDDYIEFRWSEKSIADIEIIKAFAFYPSTSDSHFKPGCLMLSDTGKTLLSLDFLTKVMREGDCNDVSMHVLQKEVNNSKLHIKAMASNNILEKDYDIVVRVTNLTDINMKFSKKDKKAIEEFMDNLIEVVNIRFNATVKTLTAILYLDINENVWLSEFIECVIIVNSKEISNCYIRNLISSKAVQYNPYNRVIDKVRRMNQKITSISSDSANYSIKINNTNQCSTIVKTLKESNKFKNIELIEIVPLEYNTKVSKGVQTEFVRRKLFERNKSRTESRSDYEGMPLRKSIKQNKSEYVETDSKLTCIGLSLKTQRDANLHSSELKKPYSKSMIEVNAILKTTYKKATKYKQILQSRTRIKQYEQIYEKSKKAVYKMNTNKSLMY